MLRKKLFVLLIFLHLCVVVPITSIGETDNWPMFHHDSNNSGLTTSDGPETNNLLWTWEKTADANEYSIVSPTVVDEKIYLPIVGDNNNDLLYCFELDTGEELWSNDVGDKIPASPVVSENKVYVISYEKILCFDSETGNELWNKSSGGNLGSSPVIVNSKIYYGSWYGIYCRDAENGDLLWHFDEYEFIKSSPVVVDERLYIASYMDELLVCLDAEGNTEEKTTSVIWSFETGEDTAEKSSPAYYNGNLYFSTLSTLYCLDTSNEGSIIWQHLIGHTNDESICPSVAYGNVYVGGKGLSGNNIRLYCLDAVGNPGEGTTEEKWNFSEGETYFPASVSNNKIYVCSDGDETNIGIYCLDAIGSNGKTSINWNYNIEGGHPIGSIAVSDGKLVTNFWSRPAVDQVISYVYVFRDNNPPETPDPPTGPKDGNAEVEYTYSTGEVTDPEEDNVFYRFDWGDETYSEWLNTPTTSHIWAEEGNYKIRVITKDQYDQESSWSEEITIIIAAPIPKLQISCPTSIIEDNNFTITITSKEEIIDNAEVVFNGETKISDESGKTTFSAPEVSSNKKYTITATKQGYAKALKNILILNQKGQQGWIFGTVSESGLYLEDARICARLVNDESTSKCTHTDEDGKYVLSLPIGEYFIESHKVGYETVTTTRLVVENNAFETNFVLENKADEKPASSAPIEDAMEYLIKSEIENGSIGVKLIFEDKANYIQIYNEALEIEIDEYIKNEKISFSVEAEGISSEIIAIKFEEKTLYDLNNLKITFDGVEISNVAFEEIFNSEESEVIAKWTSIVTNNPDGKEVGYVLIKTPLSKHIFTITSFVDTIGGPFAVMLYVLFSGIICFILGSPLIFGPHRTYKKKKGEK